MALPKQKTREIIIDALYALDVGGIGPEFTALLMEQFKTTRANIAAAVETAELIWAKKDELDAKLTQLSQSFALDRIQKTELQILRLAVYEIMLGSKEVPPKVAVSEAIRLTRKLATKEASQFVNAVLDQMLHADS